MRKSRIGPLVIGWFLAACGTPTALSPTPTPAPTALPPTVAPFFASQGGGEPRTAGYWLVWNSCTEDNRADEAAANGGREAGWIILDDLRADPGILLGTLPVETCEQGVHLLKGLDVAGQEKPDDAAYALAGQLLAAQINLAVGAETCAAIEESVQAGQLLLLSLEFDGAGQYLGPTGAAPDRDLARLLARDLATYNSGTLCR